MLQSLKTRDGPRYGVIVIYATHLSYCRLLDSETITVKPPNKGHFGSGDFVLYLEAVLWWEVRITILSTRVIL